MLHVQHRPGAPPSKPRCGFDDAVLPGYSGAGKPLLLVCCWGVCCGLQAAEAGGGGARLL